MIANYPVNDCQDLEYITMIPFVSPITGDFRQSGRLGLWQCRITEHRLKIAFIARIAEIPLKIESQNDRGLAGHYFAFSLVSLVIENVKIKQHFNQKLDLHYNIYIDTVGKLLLITRKPYRLRPNSTKRLSQCKNIF